MTRRRGTGGFTLLELLVAVAVLGMLIVLLNQGVAFGLRATSMQNRTDERQGDLETVDRAMRQLVGHADPGIFPEPASLRGTAGTLSLVTELPNPVDGQRERVEASIGLSGGQLRLHWRPRRHVAAFGPEPPARDLVLLTGVSAVRFAYASAQGWASGWTGERLPALVRMTLEFSDKARHWPPIIAAPMREALEQ